MATSKDLKALAQEIKALEGLTRIVGKRVALKIAPIIDRQFDDGADPYGSPWAPLEPATVARGRGAPPLTDTGEMRSSLKVVATGEDLTVTIDDPAHFHQYGTVNMVSREILPTDEIPKTWTDAIDETVDEVAKTFPVYSRFADKK